MGFHKTMTTLLFGMASFPPDQYTKNSKETNWWDYPHKNRTTLIFDLPSGERQY